MSLVMQLISGASSGQHFQFGHQWLGLILFIGLGIQGGLGWYHHKRYKEDKPTSKRWFTHAHLWLGRFLLFFALINIGLGIQLYGDSAAAQAVWYIFTIALAGAYAFFYWRTYIRKRKRINDSFDPSPFEDPSKPDEPNTQNYESYRPVNVAAMSDNDLGTYHSEYYDPQESGVNEYGGRIDVPTITAVNRPTMVSSGTSAGRRYDIPNPLATGPGPYRPTEPLRPGYDPQEDPFQDTRPRTGNRPRTGVPYPPADPFQDTRPRTGVPYQQEETFQETRPRTGNRPRTGVPYPLSAVSNEEMPDLSAPPYIPQESN